MKRWQQGATGKTLLLRPGAAKTSREEAALRSLCSLLVCRVDARERHVLFLPASSPIHSLLVLACSKSNTGLQRVGPRTQAARHKTIATVLLTVTDPDARGWFARERSRRGRTRRADSIFLLTDGV